jgi:uncharacterized membrane protein YgcG
MCFWKTHVLVCGHNEYTKKGPCHNKRDYEECTGQQSFRESDVRYDELPCIDCGNRLNTLEPRMRIAQLAMWRSLQQQCQANAEAERQRKEIEQAEEKRQVDEMLRKGRSGGGSSGGGSGSSSRRGGGWSDREVKKPYKR